MYFDLFLKFIENADKYIDDVEKHMLMTTASYFMRTHFESANGINED